MSRRLTALVGPLAAVLLITSCADGTEPRDDAPDTAARLASRTGVVVAAAGDIACRPGAAVTRTRCRQAATARLAGSLSPYAVITLGDEQYESGSSWGFRHSYAKSWGALRWQTWPVPGNHEYRTPGAAGYFRYFEGRTPPAPGYYRRAVNGWQVYLLNSNCEFVDCARQRNWLYNRMRQNPARCSLIAMHHPRYSSGGEHGSDPAHAAGFWRVGLRFGADVALAGHDHDYERFAAMDNSGRVRENGIQSFVSGGGGKSLYSKGATVRGSRHFRSRFGVLKLTLRPLSYSWEFRGLSGAVLDSGYRRCR